VKKTEFVDLSTRVSKDLLAWVEAARREHGLTEDQLVAFEEVAAIISQTTIRVSEEQP
jgi:alkylhydroperoxidase family enzyme